MDSNLTINIFAGAYIFMLAAVAGWSSSHTSGNSAYALMSGSNFVHGIVVVGGIYVLLNATNVRSSPSASPRYGSGR